MNTTSPLTIDPVFRERSAALARHLSAGTSSPFDEVTALLRTFMSARRRETRVSRLQKANRLDTSDWRSDGKRFAEAIGACAAAVEKLLNLAKYYQPLLTSALDDVFVLAADAQHPLRQALQQSMRESGAAEDEIAWQFAEIAKVNFRPVNLACACGFEDLLVMIEAVSVGESGLLGAGFPRFTGDAGVDERVANLVRRFRKADVTASLFLAFLIVTCAHLVATQSGAAMVQK